MAFRYNYLSLLCNCSFKTYIKHLFKPLFDKEPIPIILDYITEEDIKEYPEWDFVSIARELRVKDLK